MRLLLIEDDEPLGQALCHYLRLEGHATDLCTTLAQARSLLTEPYDALLLDWNLPDGSGVEWLEALRTRGFDTPVLMVTAHDHLSDRVRCLDAGADDYLVKPFAPEELSARIRAVKRRSAGTNQRRQYGEVEVDVTAKSARVAGQAVELTAREWAILEALVLRTGRIVTKQDLDAIVLGWHSDTTSNSLEVHISRLRSKLGKGLIQTVRGLGYRVGGV